METPGEICLTKSDRRFTTLFTEDVIDFLKEQDLKARLKILSNIRKAEVMIDQELFKKLTDEIWEFRTIWKGKRYRLLAFWEKDERRVVVATHGFIKKTSKVPIKELEKAVGIRNEYLRSKNSRNYETI